MATTLREKLASLPIERREKIEAKAQQIIAEEISLQSPGTQVERYRLAANGMETLIGFLSVIAVELFELTYLHRTEPESPLKIVLNPTQIAVLQAKSKQGPPELTVGWGVEAVARLGGYLEHRRKSPIGIQVL